jgi:endonuclease/exonuclease/phosphatase family metal-dependent hydrolase
MAQIRILSWNIEVYGPEKYGRSVNAAQLVNFVSEVIGYTQANILVVMETMSSVGDQIAFNLTEGIQAATGQNWGYFTTQARVNGDRESYGFYWRRDAAANFAPAVDANGAPVSGLATLDFPNNFSNWNGRRAAYATFTTGDTNRNFTVTVYHAPPNARAIQGLQQLAGMPQLYTVANAAPGPAGAGVPARLLCGDYNLDVNVQPDYTWLTNPVPALPPPAAPGQGAGCAPATWGNSLLGTLADAIAAWGPPVAGWPADTSQYRRALAIDNVFYATPAAGPTNGRVVDVLAQMIAPGTGIRTAAQAFNRTTPLGGPAFPNATLIPLPWNVTLSTTAYSFLFYRYAVSDHLPVSMSLTI